jgi:prepilin-type N-terminal cleavage/methylation domain-containing protein
MISLKKQRGFTIVELLIVIIVIGILATLVLVTYAGVQAKARDSKRQTDINALDSHLETFYAQYGFYPTLCDLQTIGYGFAANCNTGPGTTLTTSFVETFMQGLDPSGLQSPMGNATTGGIAATAGNSGGWAYGYVASGTGCTNTTATTITGGAPQNNSCTAFTLTADLESGGTWTKTSLT